MTTIYTFAQSAIEEARSAGRYGTANLYSGAINSFLYEKIKITPVFMAPLLSLWC